MDAIAIQLYISMIKNIVATAKRGSIPVRPLERQSPRGDCAYHGTINTQLFSQLFTRNFNQKYTFKYNKLVFK